MNLSKEHLRLYAITDRKWCTDNTLEKQIEAAIAGGVTILQLREKNTDFDNFLSLALSVRKITAKFNIPLIINDNVDIAIKCNADGVHVGQNDSEIVEIRKRWGNDKIIGVSVKTVEAALLAEKQGANYLGVGAMFSTSTKSDTSRVSFETLKEICNTVKIPVVAIGGITESNMTQLANSQICGIATVSAIFAAGSLDEIKIASCNLRKKSEELFAN
ncbi:MAG: thiamine phosphate synthase [Spirochaetales bacterium]|nr:thiamine phosphate synthase [Spirochaetales bacterium]